MKFTLVLAVAALQGVSAHTIFTDLNGQGVGNGVRVPSYNGPIQDVTSNSLACNGNPNPTTATNTVINVAAGSQAKIQWRFMLTSTTNEMIIDSSHKGPVMAYLKKVSDAKTDSGVGNGWFKISEDGWTASSDTWGVDRLIANKGLQTVTIPSCIANGQYLLRAELVALHSAGSSGGAQFYMECAQINVTGGSGAKSPATVSLPGAYKANDPGVLINIYYPKPTSYTAPGPRPFTC